VAGAERVEQAALVVDGVGEQVAIGAVDLAGARSHPPCERQQGDAGGDRERRVCVSERVGRAVLEASRPHGRLPLVAAPVVQVQIAAGKPRKEQRRIEAWGKGVESAQDTSPQRDGPQRAGLLPVVLHLSVCVDTADVKDACLPVDVATLEREPLRASKAGPGGDDRKRSVGRGELDGCCYYLGPGGERLNLPFLGSGFFTFTAGFSSSSPAATA
jgi:hypothetical protein